jgi:transposase
MRVSMEVRDQLAVRFEVLLPHLNERQQRLALAVEARLLGHGGVRAVAQVAGVSETTVRRGVFELEAGEAPFPPGRVRRPGGGRKAAARQDPDLVPALLALVEPDERGDPMSPLRWTTKSLRHLADELTRQGHPVSAPTVGKLLRQHGFSLQANAKSLEGKQHPDRDAQFRYLNEQVKEHQAAGEPVISVDAKKKELLGQLPNAGREWRPKGQPIRVEDHSFFTSPQGEQVIPYGVYDLTTDTGWVNVGVDHDTSAFAVASIRRWWQTQGHGDYPQATRLLITADAGGSNSYRYRAWKAELAALAAETGLRITVCHFPPGTSKWNKIEHRLFAHITMNWRGRPLTSHEVIVNTITATRTRTGLGVAAALDTRDYPLGVSVSKARMDALPIRPHPWHGTWNYTIHPRLVTERPADGQAATTHHDPHHARSKALEVLADPALTGMNRQELGALATRLAPAQAAQTQQRCYQQRGGRRRRAPGAGGRPLLGDADRILITIVYLRQVCSQKVLSELLEVNPTSIGQAIAATRQLLEEHRCSVTPTMLRFSRATDLLDYLDNGITASQPRSRPRLPEVLSAPVLTGMSRQELQQLTERLALRQAAQTERRRHRRRGRERLPGTRGGVFRQKITDAERVLAAVLSLRGVYTRKVLAELLGVSPRTIGNALLDVRPLLEQDGYATAPARRRFSTSAALVDFVNSQHDASATKPPA